MFILKTFTKSEYEITDEQEAYLRKIGLEGSITINGSTIKASNIAEIVKVKSDNEYRQLEEPPRIVYSKEQFIRALSEMIKGFTNHFIEKNMPIQSQRILLHMQENLKRARLAKEDKKFINPVVVLKTDYFNK